MTSSKDLKDVTINSIAKISERFKALPHRTVQLVKRMSKDLKGMLDPLKQHGLLMILKVLSYSIGLHKA